MPKPLEFELEDSKWFTGQIVPTYTGGGGKYHRNSSANKIEKEVNL